MRAVTIGNDFLVLLAVASRLLATGPSTYHWIVVRVPDFIRDQLMHDAVAVIAHCALTGRLMLLIDRAVAQRRGWARYRQHFHSAFCGLVPPARAHHRLSGRARCAGSWLRGWLADWELDHARTIGHAYLALARSWDWSGRLRSIADVSGTHEYSFYSVVLPGSNLSGRTAYGWTEDVFVGCFSRHRLLLRRRCLRPQPRHRSGVCDSKASKLQDRF